ncbi:MAG: hypothetical protein J6B77_03085, partial [Clostridia bacterium]|nr:hypothetical protein [Clostridia bacterium]
MASFFMSRSPCVLIFEREMRRAPHGASYCIHYNAISPKKQPLFLHKRGAFLLWERDKSKFIGVK